MSKSIATNPRSNDCKWAAISSKDFFGPENPGLQMSAEHGIMMASLLNANMSTEQRLDNLYHALITRKNCTPAELEAALCLPTAAQAAKRICALLGITITPRIEENILEVVRAMGKRHQKQLRLKIKALEERSKRVLRDETAKLKSRVSALNKTPK